MQTLVSVLHPHARSKKGNVSSAIVEGRAPLTAALITTEAWSPALYRNSHRHGDNFEVAYCIGVDIDEHMTLDQAVELLKPYKHLIGTSVNHQKVKNPGEPNEKPACDRFRVVLFLEEPLLTPEDYKETLKVACASLGLPLDKQAKDAARWFVPCVEVVTEQPVGRLIPVFKAAQALQPRGPVGAVSPDSNQRGKLSRATLTFLAGEDEGVDWHSRFFKAAVDLKEQGYTEEEAERKLSRASPVGALDETDLRQLSDVYRNRGGALDLRVAWPVMSPPTNTQPSKPVPSSPDNQSYLLTEILGYKFAANKRREVIYYSHKDDAAGTEPRLLTDTLLSLLNTEARRHGIQAGDSLYDVIVEVAQKNAFDPILDPLNALEWDGQDHIAQLFDTIQLPDGTKPEHRAAYALYLRRWLIGLVTKVYSPGSENNVLVFQGEQAAGKSRWIKRLAVLWPEGYGEGHVSPDDKDHELRHLDNFIWHVAEFDSTTSRREVGALKDYFTKDTVSVRRPYSKLPITGRSICSFCASVNSHEFLHDATGNRRYLVIPTVGVNADHTVDVRQVLAQAKAAMLAGERQWFTRDEIKKVNELNQSFLSKEEYLEAIEARARPGTDKLSTKRIMELLHFDHVVLTRPIRSNIRTLLERNGIKMTAVHGVSHFLVDQAALVSPDGATASNVETMKRKQIS